MRIFFFSHVLFWLFVHASVCPCVSCFVIPSNEQFEVVYVSPSWTGFQVAWFYLWLVATLLVMFFPGFGFFTLAIAEGVRWVRENGVACEEKNVCRGVCIDDGRWG